MWTDCCICCAASFSSASNYTPTLTLKTKRQEAKAAAEAAAAAAADACAVCGLLYGDDALKDDFWIACDKCNRWYHGACVELLQVGITMNAYALTHIHAQCHTAVYDQVAKHLL